MMLFQLIRFCFLINCGLCQSVADTKSLMQNLFKTNDYDKLIRPSLNQSHPTYVYVEMWLYDLHNLDEVEQKLTTSGYLYIEWTDDLLNWSPSDYGGIHRIYVPQGNIWKPDLSLHNGFEKLKEFGSNFIHVRINSNGLVQWWPFEVFETKCDIDTTYFPFDRQTCYIIFTVWDSESEDIILDDAAEGIYIDDQFKRNSEWELISSDSNKENSETTVKLCLTIQRRSLFVVVAIIVPIVLLSFLGIFTFALPIDSGERMGYTITVWLAFVVFLTIVSSSLPRNSDSLPILSVYIMIQLIIGTIIVTVSSIFARLASRSEKAIISPRIMFLVKGRRNKIQDTENANSISWKEIVSVLDFYMFWIFFVILLLTTITMFLYLGLS